MSNETDREFIQRAMRAINMQQAMIDPFQLIREACNRLLARVEAQEVTGDALYERFGYALAMRVIQSDLYGQLDARERGECDALASGSATPSPIAAAPEVMGLNVKIIPGAPDDQMVLMSRNANGSIAAAVAGERSEIFTIYGAPSLDPITVVLQDLAPEKGRLIVECYGRAWSAFWGAMGDRSLAEFIASCDADYIQTKLSPERLKKADAEYLGRISVVVRDAIRARSNGAGGGE